MAIEKTKLKSGILLSPQRLLTDHIILELFYLKPGHNGKISAFISDLDLELLQKHITNLPTSALELLQDFSRPRMFVEVQKIKSTFQGETSGSTDEQYYKNAVLGKLHRLLHDLKPFAPMMNWHHRVGESAGYVESLPCTFSTYRPQLQFEVVKRKAVLDIKTLVNINGERFALTGFKRHHFLLESRNEYFLLSLKDLETLEWLESNKPTQFGRKQDEFSKHVLAVLEKYYPVERNDLLDKTVITGAPVERVLLSELNGAFLVFTPQWTYENFVVEGPWKATHEITRNGEAFEIRRNRDTETAFAKLLESLHPNFKRQMNGYYYLSFAEAQKNQWFLKVYHQLLELNIQLTGMDLLKHFRYSTHTISLDVAITNKGEATVELVVKASFGKEEVPLAELKKILQAGQRNLLLKDGSIGILKEEWVQQYGPLFRHGKITGNNVEVPRWLAFSEEESSAYKQVLKPLINMEWWLKWQRWQNGNEMIYPLPQMVQATLRPYQQKGFEWMLLLSEAGAGACLADDMGLGKTLQTICLIAHKVTLQPQSQHLIVCPASLIYNWQQEIHKFAPGISTYVYHGSTRNAEDLKKSPGQVIITTYGTLRSDIEQLCDAVFGTVVIDESHNIKNPGAQVTRAVGMLKTATRIALSGTPVMNNTFDLYAQLNFLVPGMLGSREFFKKEYADAIDREQDAEKMQALKKLTAPFILRRTKQQVASDLPAKTETVMWCTMGEQQKQLYEEIKTTIRDSIFLNIQNQGLDRSKLAVIQGMLKLRKLCNSPLLLPEEEQTCTESVKTRLLISEICNNLKDHKVLVFSQFTSMLDLLAEKLVEEGVAYYHFDGQTPASKRIEMVNRFQREDDTTNVFLISLKAGNTGLNLTSADYVFLFDPWWNTAVQQQAIDRTHRIGQTKNVFAYKMICKDSIEEKIIQIQHRKKHLADNLVSEDEGFVKSLTKEDIEYLFS